jgi:phosphoglycerate dehydrogenase-like enzyme
MRVAILDDYQAYARTAADWSGIERRAEIVTFNRPFAGPAALIDALRNFDVICLMRERTPFPREVLEQLPNLKHVVLTGRRSQTLDVAYLNEHRIGIDYTGAGPAAHATPEIAIGLILALARQIPAGDRLMKAGEWLEHAPLGMVLHGKTLGIIGLGKVGARVAEIAATIGMRVIAWSPNLTAERAAAAGVEYRGAKQELLREADVVSMHLVLAPSTVNTIAAADFAEFKRTALLINTARGPLIEEAALVGALRSSRIAGAALDVYDVEPLPGDHPLRRLKNCILLPHFGYVTREIYDVFYRETADAVASYLDQSRLGLA